MGSSLGPAMANNFLSFYEINWQEQCPKEFKPVFLQNICWWHFCFSLNKLITSQNFVIISILFIQTCLSPLNKKNGNLLFLDIEVSREKGKFVRTLYEKPTFSGLYTHFESFLPTIYKFGMLYTLAYRCFKYRWLDQVSWRTQFFETSAFKKRVSFIIYW